MRFCCDCVSVLSRALLTCLSLVSSFRHAILLLAGQGLLSQPDCRSFLIDETPASLLCPELEDGLLVSPIFCGGEIQQDDLVPECFFLAT